MIVNAVLALDCRNASKCFQNDVQAKTLLWHVVKSFYSVARSLLWQMNTLNGWHGGHQEEVPEVEKLSIQKGKIKLHNGQNECVSNCTGLLHTQQKACVWH